MHDIRLVTSPEGEEEAGTLALILEQNEAIHLATEKLLGEDTDDLLRTLRRGDGPLKAIERLRLHQQVLRFGEEACPLQRRRDLADDGTDDLHLRRPRRGGPPQPQCADNLAGTRLQREVHHHRPLRIVRQRSRLDVLLQRTDAHAVVDVAQRPAGLQLLPPVLHAALDEEPVDLGEPLLRLLEQAGIVKRQRQLVGQRLEDGDVGLLEGLGLLRLHIEDADDLILDAQRQRHLRLRLRQVGIVEEGRILRRRLRHAGVPRVGHIADDAHLADAQPVARLQHLPTALGGGRLKHHILTPRIAQEDADVVEAELLRHPLGHRRQQPGGFADGGRGAGEVRHGEEEARSAAQLRRALLDAAAHLPEQVAQPQAHLLDAPRQVADLVLGLNLQGAIQITGRNGSDRPLQFLQRGQRTLQEKIGTASCQDEGDDEEEEIEAEVLLLLLQNVRLIVEDLHDAHQVMAVVVERHGKDDVLLIVDTAMGDDLRFSIEDAPIVLLARRKRRREGRSQQSHPPLLARRAHILDQLDLGGVAGQKPDRPVGPADILQ